MKILIPIFLWLCVVSTYAFEFPDSEIYYVETRERETLEHSAAANACKRYAKELSYSRIGSTKKFPWMAALGYFVSYEIKFACNGVIISEYFVLTAAYCVKEIRVPAVVLLGSSSLSNFPGTATYYEIQEITPHPYYSFAQRKNDIALIRLAQQINFGWIRPACLDTNIEDVRTDIKLTQTGWSPMLAEDYDDNVNQTDELVELKLQTMPLSECNETYFDFSRDKLRSVFHDGISTSHYCAYDPMKDSCGHWNGAPLQVLRRGSTPPYVIGLVSNGITYGCNKDFPEVLTRIAYYIPWIEAHVWPFDRRKVNVRTSVDVNTTNTAEDVSLYSASKNGYEQTVRLLIQNGANVNEIIDGETSLHAAAAAGQETVARLLIHNGADFTAKNRDGRSASEIATEKGFNKLARVLQENVAQKACDIYSNLPFDITRILGGESASRNEFPWMAALGYLDSSLKVSFRCGGTLISEKFVLTAAHCCLENSRPVTVRLGQVYLHDPEDTTIVENHLIRNIINHPDYSSAKKSNDIALIELVKPVYFSESIRPACLQTYLSDENPNTNLTVAGWGIVSPQWQNTSNALLKATLKTVPLSKCNSTVFDHAQSHDWTPFRNGVDLSYYCAADPNRVSDTCKGDSGGPLQIVPRQFGLSTVVGVVSSGLPCGSSSTFPGIYTRVANFVDWIESYVWPGGEVAPPLINKAALEQ